MNRAVVPAVAIGNGEELKTGGITFRIHAPPDGHSQTDIMIEVVEDSVVFGKDNILFKRASQGLTTQPSRAASTRAVWQRA